jgi:hypothetical protein
MYEVFELVQRFRHRRSLCICDLFFFDLPGVGREGARVYAHKHVQKVCARTTVPAPKLFRATSHMKMEPFLGRLPYHSLYRPPMGPASKTYTQRETDPFLEPTDRARACPSASLYILS